MTNTNKKTVTFYASPRISNHLDTLNSGEKSSFINKAVTFFLDNSPRTKEGLAPKVVLNISFTFMQMRVLMDALETMSAAQEEDGKDKFAQLANSLKVYLE